MSFNLDHPRHRRALLIALWLGAAAIAAAGIKSCSKPIEPKPQPMEMAR